MKYRRHAAILTVALLWAAPVSAQGLADLVPNLILTGITLPGGDLPGAPHSGHFTLGFPTFGGSQGTSIPDFNAIAAVVTFNDRFRNQFANFPLGSSSGGFTWSFDESLGTSRRRSDSFGPAFSERALTLGRKKVSLGFSFQHVSFDTFGGENLKDRSVTFYLPHTDCCSPAAPPPSPNVPGLEGDLIQAALTLDATADTFAAFASYGITDKLDVGIAVPISRVELMANVRATIIRLATSATPTVHTFVAGQDVIVSRFSNSGTATGIGDIVLRSKYNFYSRDSVGVSAAVDLRLPTGDEEDLLGLGATQAKFYMIFSKGSGKIQSHANLGFTASSKGPDQSTQFFESPGVSNEFNYSGGVQFVVHPRLTLNVDALGRTLIDAGKVKAAEKTFQYRPGAGSTGTVPLLTSTTNPLTGDPYRQLTYTPGNLSLGLGSVGFKFAAWSTTLITGNVLFPLTKGGLRDRAAFTLGFDFGF